jgi:hypothetical protein
VSAIGKPTQGEPGSVGKSILPARPVGPPQQAHHGATSATGAARDLRHQENSLASEPCREEIAYANRALESRGEFPLIGIFPESVDRSLVPSAIAKRLYVTLQDAEWARRVADGLAGVSSIKSAAPPLNFQETWHSALMLEVRPRSGRWFPFAALVKTSERDCLASVVDGPYGAPPHTWFGGVTDITANNSALSGIQIQAAITNLNSAYIGFTKLPTSLAFGQTPNLFQLNNLKPP